MGEAAGRHELFDSARHRAGWSVEQLWIHYLALGGTLVVLDLEAYLAGLVPVPPGQQDVLACALNERLADLGESDPVPYLYAGTEPTPAADPWALLDRLTGDGEVEGHPEP